MTSRITLFTQPDIQLLHEATMELFAETGVDFLSPESLGVFRRHGFRVDGSKVFITEKQLFEALSSVPKTFEVRARNPKNNLRLGGEDYVLASTAGAPNIIDSEGHYRNSTMADYEKFAKLIQTSSFNLVMSHRACVPSDVPPERMHLCMLQRDFTLTDRVVMCPTSNPRETLDGLHMLEIVFGGQAEVKKGPCSFNVATTLSPLKYAAEQADVIMVLADHNQPIIVTNMIMSGATGPLSVPGTLVLGNAEILAGVVLAQLVKPGVATCYGSTSCPLDMKSMVATLGAPETAWISRGTIALAEFYNIPCRTGGSLTDSHLPDAQAQIDAGLIFCNALSGGVHFVFHAFGMMSSYMAASLEKFVIDEEMVRMIIKALELPVVDKDSIDLATIKKVGSHGNYLTQPSTTKNFRHVFRSQFLNRYSNDMWVKKGSKSTLSAAKSEVEERLAAWNKPDIEKGIERALIAFGDFS